MGTRSLQAEGGVFVNGTAINLNLQYPRAVRRGNAGVAVDTAGAATYTVSQARSGFILRDPNGASRTDTLPTAAQLINGFGLLANLDSTSFAIVNTGDAAEVITLTAGANTTLTSDTVFAGGAARVLTVTRTSSTTVTVAAVNPVAAPNTINNVASANATDSAQTYTAAQVAGGYLLRTIGANRTDVTPTAALLIAALPGLGIGSTFDFVLKNGSGGAFTITLNGGVGVTLIGAITVAQNETAVLRFIRTGTATFDVVKLG